MLISTKTEHVDFLQNQVLKPIRQILDDKQLVFGFLLMGQAIEILGSYLDNKPFRTTRQSARRFSASVYQLFPGKYSSLNRENFLYFQLRACLTHMFIPTDKMSLNLGLDSKKKHHLLIENGVLILYSENFYFDLEKAVNKLIDVIQLDEIKLKKLSSGEINSNRDSQA